MLFANNCNTTLNGGITAVATSMVVTSATGFPIPTGSQYFYCTLADAATQTTIEIVKVTAVSGTTFTIVRGQDGTTGTIFASGAVVSLRLVRANLNDFAKLDEFNTFTSNLGLGTAVAPSVNGSGLAIYDTNYPRLTFRNSTTGDTAGVGTQMYGINSDWVINNAQATGNLLFYTNSTEKMRVFASGGVSIGNTTDPGAGGLKVSGAISAVIAYQASLALGAAWNPTIPTIGVSQLWQFTFVSVTPAIPRIVTGMLSSDSAGAVTWHGILTELGMYVDTSGTLRFINNTATIINLYVTGMRLL